MKDLFFKEFSARVAEVVSSGMGDGYDVSAWINAVVKDCEFVMHALEGDSLALAVVLTQTRMSRLSHGKM